MNIKHALVGFVIGAVGILAAVGVVTWSQSHYGQDALEQEKITAESS